MLPSAFDYNFAPFVSPETGSLTTKYALFSHNLHEPHGAVPQEFVLALRARAALIEIKASVEGGSLSSQELQGKYTVALGRIGGGASSGGADRHKPICQRNSQMTEQQAIEEAANALSALWKVRKSNRA